MTRPQTAASTSTRRAVVPQAVAGALSLVLLLAAGPGQAVEFAEPTPPPGLRLPGKPWSLTLVRPDAREALHGRFDTPTARPWLELNAGEAAQARWATRLGLARRPDGAAVPKLTLNLAVDF